MPQRVVQPSNAILVAGEPQYEEYEVENATNMYPGKLVKVGTGGHQVVVCTDGADSCGVLDVMEDQNLQSMYDDSSTYSVGDQVRVIRGDCTVKLRADHAGTIALGQLVYPAADGNVDEGAHSDHHVGYAEESFSAGATDDWIIVKLTNV